MVCSPDGDTDFFDIVARVLRGETLAQFVFLICLYYVLRTSNERKLFHTKKKEENSQEADDIL